MWIQFKKIKNASGLVSFILAIKPKQVELVDESELKYLKLFCIISVWFMPSSTSYITLAFLMHRIPELSVQSLWRNDFTSSAESFQENDIVLRHTIYATS